MTKPSAEAIERYRAAMQRYKKACSEYQKLRIGYKALSEPNALQEYGFHIATKEFKKACRVFHDERVLWSAAFIDTSRFEQSIKDITLKSLTSQLPETGEDAIAQEMKREAFENSEDYKTIKEAALKHAKEKAQESKEVIPMEEKSFTLTEEADVFKDLK